MGGNRLHAFNPALDGLFGAFAQTPHIVGDRDALDNRPMQGGTIFVVLLDHRLALADGLGCPDLTRFEMMQSADDFMRTRLPDMIQADRILRAKPPP